MVPLGHNTTSPTPTHELIMLVDFDLAKNPSHMENQTNKGAQSIIRTVS
jgi:hypothetical protein